MKQDIYDDISRLLVRWRRRAINYNDRANVASERGDYGIAGAARHEAD